MYAKPSWITTADEDLGIILNSVHCTIRNGKKVASCIDYFWRHHRKASKVWGHVWSRLSHNRFGWTRILVLIESDVDEFAKSHQRKSISTHRGHCAWNHPLNSYPDKMFRRIQRNTGFALVVKTERSWNRWNAVQAKSVPEEVSSSRRRSVFWISAYINQFAQSIFR